MTLQALYCEACGSRDLVLVEAGRYRCSHCGAATLADTASNGRSRATAYGVAPHRAALFGVAGLLLAIVFVIVLWQATTSPRVERMTAIDPTTVALSGATQVTSPDRPVFRDKLLVMVTNNGKRAIGAPRVVASFYDGATKLETASDYAQTGVLLPGETAPVLINMPRQRGTRQEIALATPLRSVEVVSGPVLAFERYRLVERDGRYKLAAVVKTPAGAQAMQSCRASILLLDQRNTLVAIGDGRCRVRDLAASESTTVDASFVRVSAEPVAAMRYHIDYELVQPPPAPARVVAKTGRQIVVASAVELLPSALSWDAVDLLRPK